MLSKLQSDQRRAPSSPRRVPNAPSRNTSNWSRNSSFVRPSFTCSGDKNRGCLLTLRTDANASAWTPLSSGSDWNSRRDWLVATELPADGVGEQGRHHAFDLGLGPIRHVGCS